MTAITMKEAIKRAKQFLSTEAGFSEAFLTLKEVQEQDDIWTITFDYGLTPGRSCQVQVSKSTEDISSFKRLP